MSNSLSNNKYIAILGDIIDSKMTENRNDVQNKLKQTLEIINDKYSANIIARFSIIYGDGFQGLMQISNETMNIISEIELAMYPVKFRFGIGIGNISTDISNNVYEIDGECFHFARKVLNNITENSSKQTSLNTNIMISSGPENKYDDMLVNTVLNLSYVIKRKWTKSQYEIIQTYIEKDYIQVLTAEKLKVNKATVSKVLSRTDFFSYKNALDIVSNHLYRGCEHDD